MGRVGRTRSSEAIPGKGQPAGHGRRSRGSEESQRSMRRFALLFALLFAAGVSTHAEAPPHIIFLLTDDLGPGDVGCYGGNIAATPNIDRLAREGTRFTHYYS